MAVAHGTRLKLHGQDLPTLVVVQALKLAVKLGSCYPSSSFQRALAKEESEDEEDERGLATP